MISKRWASLQDKIHIHDWFYFGNTVTRMRVNTQYVFIPHEWRRQIFIISVRPVTLFAYNFRISVILWLPRPEPKCVPFGAPSTRTPSRKCGMFSVYTVLGVSVLCRVSRCGMFSVHCTQCSQSSAGCAAVACSVYTALSALSPLQGAPLWHVQCTLHSVLSVLSRVRRCGMLSVHCTQCSLSSARCASVYS